MIWSLFKLGSFRGKDKDHLIDLDLWSRSLKKWSCPSMIWSNSLPWSCDNLRLATRSVSSFPHPIGFCGWWQSMMRFPSLSAQHWNAIRMGIWHEGTMLNQSQTRCRMLIDLPQPQGPILLPNRQHMRPLDWANWFVTVKGGASYLLLHFPGPTVHAHFLLWFQETDWRRLSNAQGGFPAHVVKIVAKGHWMGEKSSTGLG